MGAEVESGHIKGEGTVYYQHHFLPINNKCKAHNAVLCIARPKTYHHNAWQKALCQYWNPTQEVSSGIWIEYIGLTPYDLFYDWELLTNVDFSNVLFLGSLPKAPVPGPREEDAPFLMLIVLVSGFLGQWPPWLLIPGLLLYNKTTSSNNLCNTWVDTWVHTVESHLPWKISSSRVSYWTS